ASCRIACATGWPDDRKMSTPYWSRIGPYKHRCRRVLTRALCSYVVSGQSFQGFRESAKAHSQRSEAPLAQSAERFHGKEKVDSSILSGGSVHLWLRNFPSS